MIQTGFLNIILLKVNHLDEQQNQHFDFLVVDRSPRKSPSSRKSRQTTNSDVDGASGTGAASSENDE